MCIEKKTGNSDGTKLRLFLISSVSPLPFTEDAVFKIPLGGYGPSQHTNPCSFVYSLKVDDSRYVTTIALDCCMIIEADTLLTASVTR